MIWIFGYGTVGNAVHRLFGEADVRISDPRLGYKVDRNLFVTKATKADLAFICVDAKENENGYDCENVCNVLEFLKDTKFKGLVLIKTTILPEQSLLIKKVYNTLDIVEAPEFLSERTADEDIFERCVLIGGDERQFQSIESAFNSYGIFNNFKRVKYGDAFKIKLLWNLHGALQVSFWHSIYESTNWDIRSLTGTLKSLGLPSSLEYSEIFKDGVFGYSGKCFPKDVKAFLGAFKNPLLEKMDFLNSTKSLNPKYTR